METYSVKKSATKLKDSCDVCSAFKLRCDKQKPTCRRCANLDRLCTYSPARRAGRPHAVRRGSTLSQDPKRSQVPPNGSDSDSMQSCFAPLDPSNPSHRSETQAAVVDPARLSERPIDSANGFDGGCFHDMHSLSLHANSTQSADVLWPPCDFSNTSPGSDRSEADCTRVALLIVEQLETSKRWSSTACSSSPIAVRGAGLTATEACQRLLAILICPCSEQAEVALLVASACISLMDVIRGSVELDSGHASPSLTLVSHGSSEPDPLLWPRPPPSEQSSVDDGQNQVGDLSKIATVVRQFTEKYCRDVKDGPRWEHTKWVVAPVADLLRCRLQAIIQGATRNLVS